MNLEFALVIAGALLVVLLLVGVFQVVVAGIAWFIFSVFPLLSDLFEKFWNYLKRISL